MKQAIEILRDDRLNEVEKIELLQDLGFELEDIFELAIREN